MYIYINIYIYILYSTHISITHVTTKGRKKNRAWPRMQGDYPGVLLVDLGAPSRIVPWIARNGCRKWFSRYLKRIVRGFSVPKIHEYPSMSTFFSPTLWIQLYLLRKWDWGIIYYFFWRLFCTFSDSGHGSIGIGWRDNLNRKPWFFTMKYGGVRVNMFP